MKIKISLINNTVDVTGVPITHFIATDDNIEITLDEDKIAKEYSSRIRNSVASLSDAQLRKLREQPKTPDETFERDNARL